MKLHRINLDQYRRFREIMRPHHDAIPKTISRTTWMTCGKTLGLVENKRLVLESESELIILTDYCIYSHLQRGKTLVQKYLAKLPPTEDAEELQVRSAMGQDRFSMYRIEEVQRGTGLAMRDLVRGGTLFVVDKLLSKTMRKGRVLGGRLVPLPDYWITTGAAFPVSLEVVEIVEAIFLAALKITEGQLSHLRPEAHEELATVVIGASLQEGAVSYIEYQ